MTGENINFCSSFGFILLVGLFILNQNVQGQKRHKKGSRTDTVYAKAGQYIITSDTDFIAMRDTIFIVHGKSKIKVKNNPYARSEAFYDSLKVKSYQNKVSRQLYGLLIRNQKTTVSDSVNIIKSREVFLPFEGDRIRRIILKKVDILEGSVYDTSLVIETGLGKAFNSIHISTRNKIIIKNLLFDVGDKVKSYQLADNERILRTIPFIDDALIEIIPPLNDDDSVDVLVITQDLFSWGIDGSISSFDKWRIAFFNRNILGRGDELFLQYRKNEKDEPTGGGLIRLRTQNIYGSFINAEIKYQDDFEEHSLVLDFQRDFITPETKYAGGLKFGDISSYVDGRTAFDTVSKREKQIAFSKTFYDFWIGRSFIVNKKNKRQNLIFSGGILRENFSERPPTDETQNLGFQDKYLLIGGIAFIKRNYFKSNMIFNFGRTEDIPEGYTFEFDYGYEKGEFKSRPYFGVKTGAGHYFEKLGYVSFTTGLGGFVDEKEFEQGTFTVKGLYFTPLFKIKRTKIRQFLTVNYTLGFKRDSIDVVNLRNFVRGVNGGRYRGDERLSINYEADFFTPVYIYGFKLLIFPFVDLGWLGFREKLIKSDNFYYGFGLGARFRNESFIIRTIGISFSFYPLVVEASPNFNIEFSASDPSLFRNFSDAKPEIIDFK